MLRRIVKQSTAAVLVLILVSLGYIAGWSARNDAAAQERQHFLTSTEKIYANLYNQVSPSVVSISLIDRLFGDEISNGSGFVLDNEGYILTNAHVVDDASERVFVAVAFFDGTHTRGEIIGIDRESDLAVLRVDIPPERLRPITFADSGELLIGQIALAIGSPFGQKWTMTAGIISALDRTINGLGNFDIGAVIQTDAPINPGNSGGPLLNMAGEVIGVNAQIISEDRSNSGIGFAIPARLAMRVAEALRAEGRVEYSYLGVQGSNDMSLGVIERLGLPNDTRGLVIGGVTGPAQTAGLLSNDVITAIDSMPVGGLGVLLSYLATYTRPGQMINLTVIRDGERVVIPVELGAR